MNLPSDTIAAIATAPGEAGIAIIRISGPGSLGLADALVACRGLPPSRRPAGAFFRGRVRAESRWLDEALVLVMRAPHSYTREDVVEIQCHGGAVCARQILESVLALGARLADPGEFTRRAFLNGRLDLIQAEAVLDLIRAQSDRSASAAIEQLSGRLSSSFNKIYDDTMRVCADLEAALDFSEEESDPDLMPRSVAALRTVLTAIDDLAATWHEGQWLREGALAVISGQPNVGKSTLMNALLGRDRAIVSPVPGTTRDIIEETFILDGIPLRLIDTAGLRPSACAVEQEGIRRAQLYIRNADLHIHILDASRQLDPESLDLILTLPREKCILVLNKIDLGIVINPNPLHNFAVVQSQLNADKGLKEILINIRRIISSGNPSIRHANISSRHKKLLDQASSEIRQASRILESGHEANLVLAASNCRHALDSLGQITGKVFHETLLDSIFSRFCVGK